MRGTVPVKLLPRNPALETCLLFVWKRQNVHQNWRVYVRVTMTPPRGLRVYCSSEKITSRVIFSAHGCILRVSTFWMLKYISFPVSLSSVVFMDLDKLRVLQEFTNLLVSYWLVPVWRHIIWILISRVPRGSCLLNSAACPPTRIGISAFESKFPLWELKLIRVMKIVYFFKNEIIICFYLYLVLSTIQHKCVCFCTCFILPSFSVCSGL